MSCSNEGCKSVFVRKVGSFLESAMAPLSLVYECLKGRYICVFKSASRLMFSFCKRWSKDVDASRLSEPLVLDNFYTNSCNCRIFKPLSRSSSLFLTFCFALVSWRLSCCSTTYGLGCFGKPNSLRIQKHLSHVPGSSGRGTSPHYRPQIHHICQRSNHDLPMRW